MNDDGSLAVPGESVTDPVAYTIALASASVRLGVNVWTGWRVAGITEVEDGLELHEPGGARLQCRVAVNCAGLRADEVAALAGDRSFEIYPRKGEFLVFDPGEAGRLNQILLPVPTDRTKGVLVFPTLDGKVVAGPTAIDQEDKEDWSVRDSAAGEILATGRAYVPAARGGGAGDRLRRPPSRGPRRELRDRGVPGMLAARERGRDQVHGTHGVAGNRRERVRSWCATWGSSSAS